MNVLTLSLATPYEFVRENGHLTAQRRVGGLFSVVDPVMRDVGGVWITAPDESDDLDQTVDGGEPIPVPPEADRSSRYRLYRTFPENADEQLYYEYIDRVHWPLFHGHLEYVADSIAEEAIRDTYEKVNRFFARSAVRIAEAHDIDSFWIHDFQIMSVPRYIRNERPEATIVYFHHVPVPPAATLEDEPEMNDLVSGATAADTIGVQTTTDAKNLMSIADSRGYDVDRSKFRIGTGRGTTNVMVHPVGVDTDRLEQAAREENRPARDFGVSNVIVGIDRMDYTKGIARKLEGYRRLLRRNAEFRHDTVLYQSLSLSKATTYDEYVAAFEEVRSIAAEINDEYGTEDYRPVVLETERLDTRDLVWLYQQADVALVTPTADGMNLVVKEFVFTQSLVDGPVGVPVLTEGAGAAEFLEEAFVVEPEPDDIASVLETALLVDESEKSRRISKMAQRIAERDNRWWADQQLALLTAPPVL